MAVDEDIATFLDYSGSYMNIEALEPGWEEHFVEVILNLRAAERKARFRRGFAKILLGQLTPREYERATDWDFDTPEEFEAHLWHYWRMFYGQDDPAASL